MSANVLRWVPGVLLVWAALGKVANPQDFYIALQSYQLPAPGWLLHGTAVVLPWLELLCGLLLLANLHARAAFRWAVLLFAGFAVVTGQAWARGLEIDCGCLDLRWLGVDPATPGHWLASPAFACVRAVVLLGVSVAGCRRLSQAE